MVERELKKQVFSRESSLQPRQSITMFASREAGFGEHSTVEKSLCFSPWERKNREDEIIDILSKLLKGELTLLLNVAYSAAESISFLAATSLLFYISNKVHSRKTSCATM